MSTPPSGPDVARAFLLERLKNFAVETPEIRVFWLQGSLAAGGADPFSDIDAYLGVDDPALETTWTGRSAILAGLGGALAWSDGTTPGLKVVHALMQDGVRLDLFFEPVGALAAQKRPAVKVLHDPDGLAAGLQTGWEAPAPVIGHIIGVILKMTRQGSTWPLRLLGRGHWSTLAMMELDLVNAQVAQLMAVGNEPGDFYRNSFSLGARLSVDQQVVLDDLTGEVLAALSGRDVMALKAAHLKIFDALGREGRRACLRLGVAYPIDDANEASIRALLERDWPTS